MKNNDFKVGDLVEYKEYPDIKNPIANKLFLVSENKPINLSTMQDNTYFVLYDIKLGTYKHAVKQMYRKVDLKDKKSFFDNIKEKCSRFYEKVMDL